MTTPTVILLCTIGGSREPILTTLRQTTRPRFLWEEI